MSDVPDTYTIARMYKYLRVCDVADALDAVGRPSITLPDPEIRPLFPGLKFWGPAVTMRAVPANKPMRVLSREEVNRSHSLWFEDVGRGPNVAEHVKPGCVVVVDAHGCPGVGIWGSANSLSMVARGAVGLVTSGPARDTGELIQTRTPVACRGRGRVITPGRNLFVGVMEYIDCGGALVRPGDIVGCDDDGLVVVPAEVAEEVGKLASDILIHDEKGRRQLYAQVGLALDDSVDVERLEEFYKPWR